jgi:hypothetical protein
MKSYTAHIKPDCPPVLLPDGWSWGAAIFGPLWLLAHRAWIPAALFAAVVVLVQLLMPTVLASLIGLGLGVLAGLLGRDAVRWSLERRDYLLTHVLVARDEEGALARLLQARTDLNAAFIGPLG